MLVVLPYVSIVSEKTEHLSAVLAPMHASVKGFFGTEEKGQALAPRWAGRQAAGQARGWMGSWVPGCCTQAGWHDNRLQMHWLIVCVWVM